MKRVIGLTMLIGMLIAACQPDQSGEQEQATQPTASSTTAPDTATPTESSTPTATLSTAAAIFTATIEARETGYAITNLTQTAAALSNATPLPTLRPTLPPRSAFGDRYRLYPAPIELPAPIMLSMFDVPGVWLLDGKSDPVLVSESYFSLNSGRSNDGSRAVFQQSEDIWLIDIGSQTKVNVSNTSNRAEIFPVWWAGREGFAVGVSPEIVGSYRGATQLAYLGVDGQLEILDETVGLAFEPSVSPDGNTIAYVIQPSSNTVDQLKLLRIGEAPQIVDLAAYGLPEVKQVVSLSWSPDGTQLGIVALSDFALNPSRAVRKYIIVLDLEPSTFRVLWEGEISTIQPYAGSVPVWAASGDWLGFHGIELVPTSSVSSGPVGGLWYADNGEVRLLADESYVTDYPLSPSISSDEQWVMIPDFSAITLIRLSDGALFSWQMPSTPSQLAWTAAP